MKYVWLALAAVGLLVQASGAHAISFSPPRSLALTAGLDEEQFAAVGKKWTVGLSGSSWGLPDLAGPGFTVDFESKLRPLLTADYQIEDKISVGGWYNWIGWDATVRTGAAPPFKADISGSVLEVHGTYLLPRGFAGQLGYQRWHLKVVGTNVDAHLLTAWATKTFDLKAGTKGALSAVAGLGLAQGLDSDSGPLQLNGQLGASYAFSPQYSADASVWFSDFTRSENSMARFTFGVTGRF